MINENIMTEKTIDKDLQNHCGCLSRVHCLYKEKYDMSNAQYCLRNTSG